MASAVIRKEGGPEAGYPARPREVAWVSFGVLLFSGLAEAAWVFQICLLAAAAVQREPIGPAAVLLPYGAAIATTALLRRWARGRGARLGCSRGPAEPPAGTPSAGHLRRVLNGMVALAVPSAQLSMGILFLLLVAWWERYRGMPLADLSWLLRAVHEIRNPSGDGLQPLGLLALLFFVLWWRGMHLATEERSFGSLAARIIWSVALLMVAWTVNGGLRLAEEAAGWSAAFLLSSLVALSMARLEATGRRGWGLVDASWGWKGPILALLLLSAGAGVAVLLYPALTALAAGLQGLILDVVIPTIQELLRLLARLLGVDGPIRPLPTPAETASLPVGEPPSYPSLPESLRMVARRLFDLSWISILLYAFYLWARRWRLEAGPGGWSPSRAGGTWGWRAIPLALLRALVRLLRPRVHRREPSPDPSDPAMAVRVLYRLLLRRAARSGLSRRPEATPWEYREALSSRWPEMEDDFTAITATYLQARYGSLPPSRESLDEVKRRSRRVQRFLDAVRRRRGSPQGR